MNVKVPLRRFLSQSAYLGLVPSPATLRPPGVSAITLARNEEDWIETSVISVMNAVDEILVADNGSVDSTPDILVRLGERFPRKVRLLDLGGANFVDATNLLMEKSRYRWLLRWHGDFVARTSGPLSAHSLVQRILLLNPLRHYCIALSGVALDGDLEHQFKDRVDDPENFLYTFSPWLGYREAGRWEELHVPWFYAKQTWPEHYYFHMRSVKSGIRLLQKVYQGHWFQARATGRDISLEDFVHEQVRTDLGTTDLTEAAERFVVRYFQDAVPFSREVCGEYPEILLPALQDPPFRLMTKSGVVAGRTEAKRFRPQSTAA